MWVVWMSVLSCLFCFCFFFFLFCFFLRGLGEGQVCVCVSFRFKSPVLIYNNGQSFYITFALSYLYLPQM